jgi:hypothetical protein
VRGPFADTSPVALRAEHVQYLDGLSVCRAEPVRLVRVELGDLAGAQ